MPKTIEITGEGQIPKNRVETLADGVFAISLTLMAFNLHVPDIAKGREMAELAPKLLAMLPTFEMYVLSFVVVGICWIGHHIQYHYIRHVNRVVLWLNLLFLALVSVTPFTTLLLGRYGHHPVAVWVYSGNLLAVGLVNIIHWRYVCSREDLVSRELDEEARRIGLFRIAVVPVVALLAAALSFVSPAWSIKTYYLIVVFYFLLIRRLNVRFGRGRTV